MHMLHLHSYTSRVNSTAWRPFAVRDVASTTILPLPEQEITSPALTTELPLASFQFTLHTHTRLRKLLRVATVHYLVMQNG